MMIGRDIIVDMRADDRDISLGILPAFQRSFERPTSLILFRIDYTAKILHIS